MPQVPRGRRRRPTVRWRRSTPPKAGPRRGGGGSWPRKGTGSAGGRGRASVGSAAVAPVERQRVRPGAVGEAPVALRNPALQKEGSAGRVLRQGVRRSPLRPEVAPLSEMVFSQRGTQGANHDARGILQKSGPAGVGGGVSKRQPEAATLADETGIHESTKAPDGPAHRRPPGAARRAGRRSPVQPRELLLQRGLCLVCALGHKNL